MTIRTKEAEVPDEFPPARLYLDDIEEIVGILITSTKNKEQSRGPRDEVDETRVRFMIKDRICDEVQELPKIAKKTAELLVTVERPKWGPETSLRFTKDITYLDSFGFTKAEQLATFNKLSPIFKRRNLWFRTLIHSHFLPLVGFALGSLLAAITSLFVVVALSQILNKHIPRTQLTGVALLFFILFITIFTTTHHHSIIILRHSLEPSTLHQHLLQKIPLVVISAVLTFLLTLLGVYLKHKYWP